MQQEKRRRVFWPGFAVGDREAVHFHRAVRGALRHGGLLRMNENIAEQKQHDNQTEPTDPCEAHNSPFRD
jgi:hypothetical protein